MSMTEIVYTCEHCGTQYTITEPGRYQCQNCNNVFTVEDPEQIRERAEAQAIPHAQAIPQAQAQYFQYQMNKRKNNGFIGFCLIWVIIAFLIASLFFQLILGVEDTTKQKKRDHIEQIEKNLESSREAYFNDITNDVKRQRYEDDQEELKRQKREYGNISENGTNIMDMIDDGVKLFFCIIFLELYTMVQRIEQNARKGG